MSSMGPSPSSSPSSPSSSSSYVIIHIHVFIILIPHSSFIVIIIIIIIIIRFSGCNTATNSNKNKQTHQPLLPTRQRQATLEGIEPSTGHTVKVAKPFWPNRSSRWASPFLGWIPSGTFMDLLWKNGGLTIKKWCFDGIWRISLQSTKITMETHHFY